MGESYFFDLLAGDTGEIYALTSNNYKSTLTGHPVVVWKSTNEADTWTELLSQPDELNEGCDLIAGDLRKNDSGIEAVVIIGEGTGNDQINRVYQITADSYIEYDMDEVYTQLGGPVHLFNVKYVNNHIIALAGTEKCLLYDTDTQKVVKNLPYNLTMGCLKTKDQFLLYGKEIYSCLNAETLEEQKPEEKLQEFVQTMFQRNNNEVFPPMTVWNDTVVCVTKAGIYEYKAGETTQVKQFSSTVGNSRVFNGLLPICKSQDGKYYVYSLESSLENTKMVLWQIDGDKEVMKWTAPIF